MAGLVPAMHVLFAVPPRKTWMPAMTPRITRGVSLRAFS